MQFFISHLARWLRTRRFSEPTFRPSGATNYRKSTVIHDFSIFLRICIFFLLTLSLLRSSLFYSSLLSDSSHLCFSSVHIVWTLTSKLPSVTIRGCLISLWETSVNHCRKLPSSALGSEIVSGSNLYNMCVYIYIYLSICICIYISTKKNRLRIWCLRCIHPSSKKCLGVLICASSIPRQDRVMFSRRHLEEIECKTPVCHHNRDNPSNLLCWNRVALRKLYGPFQAVASVTTKKSIRTTTVSLPTGAAPVYSSGFAVPRPWRQYPTS